MRNKTIHKSVLSNEALEFLNIKQGALFIDATFGSGGHTKKILEKGARVLGIDVDPQAIKTGAREFSIPLKEQKGNLASESENLILVQGNFANLEEIANKFGVRETSGILFDLGISSVQLEEGKKGLSFLIDEPLDMRLDSNLEVRASDLINGLNQGELYELFSKFGEEPASRRISRAIVKSRVEKKIETSRQLSELIERTSPRRKKIHPATRVFQALRIAVNDELNNLEKGLEQAVALLEKNGRIVVISFHSLEDRIVKNFFKEKSGLNVVTKKPLVPGKEELLENKRARSAKLRVAEKS